MAASVVLACGAAVPARTVTNEELAPMLDVAPAAIAERTGVARRHWVTPGAGPSDLGQTFVVVDPAAADPAGGFVERLEGYLDQLVSAPTVPDAPGRVLVAGEPEAEAEGRSDARGIAIDAIHAASLEAIGERAGIPFPAGDSVTSSGDA